MADDPEDEQASLAFAATLGMFAMDWNRAEWAVSRLLTHLAGYPRSALITAELGPRGVEDALNSYAEDLPSDLRDAIKHVVRYASTLRAYRNYYIHGIVTFEALDGGGEGVVHSISSKGSFKLTKDRVPQPKILAAALHAETLETYSNGLIPRVRWETEHQKGVCPELPPAPEPPEPLQRPHRRLQLQWQRREPSEE